MCGIAGFFTREPIATPAVEAAMLHRGPDHTGILKREFPGGILTLIHARLSIIDLSDSGNQPMSVGNVHILFNGEVYNFKELKKQFLADESFYSGTDTEVILRLYRVLGPDFVGHLNGDFAFAILDESINELLLYRDRLGIKPLYLLQASNSFCFASEIKSFFAAGFQPGLNTAEIGSYLTFKYSPEDATLFSGVKRLPPAHYLRLNLLNGSQQLHRYWDSSEYQKPYRGSYADACEELYALLKDSVALRLHADVPVSSYLSGGVDSAVIAHFLKGKEVVHYCAVKDKSDLLREGTTSDGAYARLLAGRWGLDLQTIQIGSGELTENAIGHSIYYSDDLIADGSQIPAMLIAEQAAKHHRVALSGMGADELFLGYNGHALTYLSKKLKRIPGGAFAFNQLGRVSAGRGAFKAYRRYIQKFGNNFNRPYEYARYSMVGDMDSAAAVWAGTNHTEEVLERYFPKTAEPFEALFRFELDNFLQKNLNYSDKTAMAFSLETRVPFLDHRVVQFAAQLPVSWNISGTLRQKKLLKDTFKPHLPKEILNRRKAGFGMPLRSLLSNSQRVDELLDLEFFGNFSHFSIEKIKQIADLHQKGVQDHSALLYALISFRIWHKQFFENTTPWNNLYKI